MTDPNYMLVPIKEYAEIAELEDFKVLAEKRSAKQVDHIEKLHNELAENKALFDELYSDKELKLWAVHCVR